MSETSTTRARRQSSDEIADFVRQKVYGATWGAGKKLPSENTLAAQFGVSRGTARRAIRQLVDEGLLAQEQGRGTFVRKPVMLHPGGDRALSLAGALKASGVSFTTNVLLKEVIDATPLMASNLSVAEGSPILHVERVRSNVDEGPLMVLYDWIPLEVCPGADLMDFEALPLVEIVEATSNEHVSWASMAYSALAAGADVGPALGVPETSPTLCLEQITYLTSGKAAEWGRCFLPAGHVISGMGFQMGRGLSSL